MTVTQMQHKRTVQLPTTLQSTWQFARKLLWASLRNVKGMALTLGLPLFMLFTFWISTRDGSQESEDLIAIMFPAVVALSVMMAGQTQATRLSRWQEQGIFERLLLTPTPLANLILGSALGQVVVGIIQGVAVLLLGLALGGIAVNLGGALLPLCYAVGLWTYLKINPLDVIMVSMITAVAAYLLSKPIHGFGIGLPILVVPFITAISCKMLLTEDLFASAYIAATFGVILGTDVLRIKDLKQIGSCFISIGGAGVFDGIALSGIIASLITLII